MPQAKAGPLPTALSWRTPSSLKIPWTAVVCSSGETANRHPLNGTPTAQDSGVTARDVPLSELWNLMVCVGGLALTAAALSAILAHALFEKLEENLGNRPSD